jgi:peptidyl-prolyl cis-trans isomerase SurA
MKSISIYSHQCFRLYVALASCWMMVLACDTKAQAIQGEALDRIVAIVGKEIVLKSEVDGQVFMIAQQSKEIKTDDPAIKKRVLDALINDRLMFNKANEDSIQVSDEEINGQLEATIQQMIAQVGSEDRLEKVYQMPIWKIRRDGREEIKKRILTERVRQQLFSEVKCTPREVEEFYNRYRDSLPEVTQQVELAHIVRYITPSTTTKDKALQKARKVRDSILSGADFCELAKRHSADPGSAGSCGELGMRNCTDFVAEYCGASKKLQVGETSLPIESPFGYHIIQLLDRTKEQVKTRHILISVPRQDDDIANAKNMLSEIKKKVENKEITFEDAAKSMSEEKETQGFGGFLGKSPLGSLDATLKAQVEALSDGGMTEPLPYQTDRTKPALHIVMRKRTIPTHKPTLETDYKEIERVANSFKQNREYEKLIQTLRSEFHWELVEQ